MEAVLAVFNQVKLEGAGWLKGTERDKGVPIHALFTIRWTYGIDFCMRQGRIYDTTYVLSHANLSSEACDVGHLE
jgi:hypothetical protein